MERRHLFFRRPHALLLTLLIPALAAAQTAAPASVGPANKSAANACPQLAADAGRFAGVFVALYPQKVVTANGREDTAVKASSELSLQKLVVDLQNAGESDAFHLKAVKKWLPTEWRLNNGKSLAGPDELTGLTPQTCKESQACFKKRTEECKNGLARANSSSSVPNASAENISSKCQADLGFHCEPCLESRQQSLARRACLIIKDNDNNKELEAADKYLLLVSALVSFQDNSLRPGEPAVSAQREIFQCKNGEPEIVSQSLRLPSTCVDELKIKPSEKFVPDELKRLIGLAVADAKKDIPPSAAPAGPKGGGTLPSGTSGSAISGGPSPLVDTGIKTPPLVTKDTTGSTAKEGAPQRSLAMKSALAYIGSSVIASGVTFAILGGLNWSEATTRNFGSGCGDMQDMSCVVIRNQLNSGVAVAGIVHAVSIIGLGITLGLEGHRPDKSKPTPAPAVTPAAENHDEQAQ